MATAFNVCALIEHWRVSIPPGGTEEHGIDIPDPGWYVMLRGSFKGSAIYTNVCRTVAVNSVSLVSAIVANFALLMNMGRRLRFTVAQPITIIGWYLTSFLLIVLLAATVRDLKLPAGEDRALNQAFYYAIMAAALYFIVATLMCFTVYGTWQEYYPKEFELSTSQRTLMLQTIILLVYLLGGAAVYAHIESWTFLDAVYWADFTLLTVGIGDYAPATHLGRGLLFPYAIFGIVFLGLVVGSIRALVLERGKKKLGARMVEKNREKVLQNLDNGAGKIKLTPISKAHPMTTNGKSERQRRADEFELMRKIQDSAASRRKWVSLFTSGGAWFFLWFIGALVFYKAERNQNWSYFESLC